MPCRRGGGPQTHAGNRDRTVPSPMAQGSQVPIPVPGPSGLFPGLQPGEPVLPSLHLRTLYPDPSPGTLPGQDGSKGHWMLGTACRTWLQHPSLGGTPASACPELRHVPTPQVWSEKQPGREIEGSGHTCQQSAACRSRSGTRAPGRQGNTVCRGTGQPRGKEQLRMPRGCPGDAVAVLHSMSGRICLLQGCTSQPLLPTGRHRWRAPRVLHAGT